MLFWKVPLDIFRMNFLRFLNNITGARSCRKCRSWGPLHFLLRESQGTTPPLPPAHLSSAAPSSESPVNFWGDNALWEVGVGSGGGTGWLEDGPLAHVLTRLFMGVRRKPSVRRCRAGSGDARGHARGQRILSV